MIKRWYLGRPEYSFRESVNALEPMTNEKPRCAGEWRTCCKSRSMYVVQPSFNQKWEASAWLNHNMLGCGLGSERYWLTLRRCQTKSVSARARRRRPKCDRLPR